MDNYVSIMVSGRVGQDPKIHRTKEDNKEFATFPLAVNKYNKGENVTEWYNCICFQEREVNRLSIYVKKGIPVIVMGIPSMKSYTNPAGKTTFSVNVEVKTLLLPLVNKETNSFTDSKAEISENIGKKKIENTEPVYIYDDHIHDDDIPF